MSTYVDCVTSSGSTCTKWKLSFHGPCHQHRPKCRKLHARPLPCSKCRNSPSRRVEPISTVLRQMNNGSKLRQFWECRREFCPPVSLSCAHRVRRLQRRSRAHCCRSTFANPVCRRERRQRRG